MGAWGVRALDSDEGLDVFDEFTDYCIENDEIKMGDLLEHFKETGFLPEKPEEIDFLYDHTVMVLAELLEEYHKNGKVIINYENDDDEDIEEEITNISFDKENVSFLIEQISDILKTKNEMNEKNEIWEDSDSFQKWKEHNLVLLKTLKEIKDNL